MLKSKLYFSEKTKQVSEPGLYAFGIHIQSRYGKANEIIEMLQFCEAIAQKEAHSFIESLFYDSKATICTIFPKCDLDVVPWIQSIIGDIAQSTLSQYELDGYIEHTISKAAAENERVVNNIFRIASGQKQTS